jgi:hypothetical protein
MQEDMDYFVALHEVGHVVNGSPRGSLRLEREGDAWTFALDNTIIDVEYPIRQRICSLLVRYWFRAQKAKWKIPEEGAFWEHMIWWDK